MEFPVVELLKLCWCSGMNAAEARGFMRNEYRKYTPLGAVTGLFINWDFQAEKINLSKEFRGNVA